MGCTSSTPNMVNSSTTEKSIHFEEEMSDNQSKHTEELIYRAANDVNETTAHPTCDTLAERHVHVVRNRSTPSLKTEKDDQEDREFSVISHKQTVSRDIIHEEKVPKLEEVVEKVVELYTSENLNQTEPVSKISEETQKSQEFSAKSNNIKELQKIEVVGDNEETVKVELDEHKKCHPEEAISPTQSESSRATRWEALADIAAELPPSLTVDPITGQIYAVSK